MGDFLSFCANNFWIFLILAFVFGMGVAGYYVDYNTNILAIEKKKKALMVKNMHINEIKSQIKDKNVSLGGMTASNSNNSNANVNAIPANDGMTAGNVNQNVNTMNTTTVNQNVNMGNNNMAVNGGQEDLTVPFKLDV